MKLCVIGAGPASAYFIKEVLTTRKDVTFDVFEKERAPLGYLRCGVAPDQLGLKATIPSLTEVLRHPRVKYFPGIEMGKDLHLREIQKYYDGVVIGSGAKGPRLLDVPGSRHAISADALIRKINNCPGPSVPRLSGTVAIIGNGNVSLDAARMLLHSKVLGEKTGSSYLKDLSVDKAIVIGRNSPLETKFTNAVLAELFFSPLQVLQSNRLQEWFKQLTFAKVGRIAKRTLSLLAKDGVNTRPGTELSNGQSAVEFVFWERPISITKDQKKLTLTTEDDLGRQHHRSVDHVIAAIGYEAASNEEMIKDLAIPVYTIGWAQSRGSGNLSNALETGVELSGQLPPLRPSEVLN
ncbi:adrenodoxin-NADP+ reductase [Nematocida displodere]|uniref:Adrenodoxin-NADP+ reductase n=1 Tax=Nematocida displodere TaxID=1805483 RepID=A0A177EK94_9MICR|nr:adrenodoxin-NADP+ reductase [Nematocida displodere]